MRDTTNHSLPGAATLVSESLLLTSEAGDRIAEGAALEFRQGTATGAAIVVDPRSPRQTLLGIGSSFTEASAFVLAHLEPGRREQVMRDIYSEQGANFSLARTPIGACDFCVEGRYSYADVAGDVGLAAFDIGVDHDGFDPAVYPGIRDPRFDLLPMIQQALRIKAEQADPTLRLIASPWTAPAWMKDIEDWYTPGTPENDHDGTGGHLQERYRATFADYLVRYLEAYRERGVDIWGITPINEPHGNNGQWESMHCTAAEQRDFIRDFLGPRLAQSDHAAVRLLCFDHNRTGLEQWVETLYSDPDCAQYLYGAAVHWYESSFRVHEGEFERSHRRFPQCAIVHTEGCIDDLGNPAPPGVLDPEGYQESGWFDNDSFWWNENASDWAYSVTWSGVDAGDHPLYTPVHRYVRNILVSLNHWLEGWIDWNVVLDRRGGPNHVGNYCGAPIMIDTGSGQVYYTPVYFVLAQLSRTIRPGDRVVASRLLDLDDEAIYACATLSADGLLSLQVLNTDRAPRRYSIQIGNRVAEVLQAANSLQTIRLRLDDKGPVR